MRTEDHDVVAEGARRSAAILVPRITRGRALRVVDVGCGRGWWSKELAGQHCDVTSVEHCDTETLDELVVFSHDLTHPLLLGPEFDLALCLEVGEHLPEESASTLVDSLCALSSHVVFSAAIPFQTGPGHINCQWQSWWAEKFEKRGYGVNVDLRWDAWTDGRIEPWYRQNIFTATLGEASSVVGPMDVVHPEIHYWGR